MNNFKMLLIFFSDEDSQVYVRETLEELCTVHGKWIKVYHVILTHYTLVSGDIVVETLSAALNDISKYFKGGVTR